MLSQYRIPLILTVCVLIVVIYAAIENRATAPGAETKALEHEFQPYIGKTFDAVSAHFGEPDSGYFPTINGTPYAGWIYKRKDGQVRVMGPVRANYIEWVFAEPLGS